MKGKVKSLFRAFNRFYSTSGARLKMPLEDLLAKETVRMQNKDAVMAKLKRMASDGVQKLQVQY